MKPPEDSAGASLRAIDAGILGRPSERMLLAHTVNDGLTILRDHPLMAGSTFTQAIAFCILDGAGPQVIWDLHLIAAHADRAGRRDLADGFAEIADAVEQEWLRSQRVRVDRRRKGDRRSPSG